MPASKVEPYKKRKKETKEPRNLAIVRISNPGGLSTNDLEMEACLLFTDGYFPTIRAISQVSSASELQHQLTLPNKRFFGRFLVIQFHCPPSPPPTHTHTFFHEEETSNGLNLLSNTSFPSSAASHHPGGYPSQDRNHF